MPGPIVHISDSSQFKQEVAKINRQQTVQQTNMAVNPTLEQQLAPKPYGLDGAEFSKHNAPVNYNPFATILPQSKINKAEEKTKKRWSDPVGEEEEDEMEQNIHGSGSTAKKKSFWEDLFGEDPA